MKEREFEERERERFGGVPSLTLSLLSYEIREPNRRTIATNDGDAENHRRDCHGVCRHKNLPEIIISIIILFFEYSIYRVGF